MFSNLRRPLSALAVVALAGSALAGCQAGKAATVAGERISETTVSAVATELPRVTGQDASQSAALANLLLATAITTAAGENGLVMSNDEVRAALTNLKIDSADISEETLKIAKASLLNQQIATSQAKQAISERVTEILSAADVNPRYGIDAAKGTAMAPPVWLVSTTQ